MNRLLVYTAKLCRHKYCAVDLCPCVQHRLTIHMFSYTFNSIWKSLFIYFSAHLWLLSLRTLYIVGPAWLLLLFLWLWFFLFHVLLLLLLLLLVFVAVSCFLFSFCGFVCFSHIVSINSGWQRVYRVTSAINNNNNVHTPLACIVRETRQPAFIIIIFRERKLCWLKGRYDAWMHDRHKFRMDEMDGFIFRNEKNKDTKKWLERFTFEN